MAKATQQREIAVRRAQTEVKRSAEARDKVIRLRIDDKETKGQTFVIRDGDLMAPAKASATMTADVDKLMKSLTVEQKDLQRTRGYVRYNELSKQQKAWLGIKPSTSVSGWTISLKLNQQEVTIKE